MKTSSNKSRTWINIIGLPSILFVVYQGGILFQLFICLVMFLAIKEFSELMKIKKYSLNNLFMYFMIPLILLSNTISFNEFLSPLLNERFGVVDYSFWLVDIIGVMIVFIICIYCI